MKTDDVETTRTEGTAGTAGSTGSAMAVVHLAPGREKTARGGNPWVFSGAVARVEGDRNAPLARVISASGEELGVGFFSHGSQITVRLLGSGVERVDRGFFRQRLETALALRRAVVPPETTGYRVINSEGDGLPGWTVDRFGDVLVSQITCRGLEALRGEACAELLAAFPGASMVQKNDLPARRREGLTRQDEVIAGEIPERAAFTEHGLRLIAEISAGQKTGFYLDQRESRHRVGELARDELTASRGILDLFAHTGAFSLHALRAGVRRAVAVESSARLAELGREQLAANGLGEERIEWVEGNVFEVLRENPEPLAAPFGLVICDPPPLVPRKRDLDRGSRAYKDLNRLALRRLAPGGFFLTFTCSAAVDGKLFRQILYAAASEAGVSLQLLAPLAAAPDHPVALAHPEGEYLKGWLGRVV